MAKERKVHGVLGLFVSAGELVVAARKLRAAGYTRLEGYTPYHVEELGEILQRNARGIPVAVFAGGATGALCGWFLQYGLAVIDYPLNVGGRPLNSWPAFIPVTFELTILFAAFAALGAFLVFNRLPQPYHPLFNVPDFALATQNRFFLCLEAADPLFDSAKAAQDLRDAGAAATWEAPADE